MKCESCPAGWEDRSYEGECNACGCRILGNELFNDKCKLSTAEIDRRLRQLEDYEAGKIDRPQWIANRFIRELDAACVISGDLSLGLPAYPPKRMCKGVYYPIHGRIDLHDSYEAGYRKGYEDGKSGKEYDNGKSAPDASEKPRSLVFA